MGAELSALGRVESALEEGAEDGGLDLGPVEVGGVGDGAQLVAGEAEGGVVVEESAVEPFDALGAEESAGFAVGHQPEESGESAGELGGVVLAGLDQVGHQASRQQADVLGEEAEEDAVEEVGDGFGFVSTVLHGAGEVGEARGGGLGDFVRGLARAQVLRFDHHGAKDAHGLGGLVAAGGEVVEGDLVDAGSSVGEVGVDLDAVHVADDEGGRVFEVFAVVEELAVGGGEVGAVALVLPAEVSALPDVGPALSAGAEALGAGLEGVGLACGVGFSGGLDAEEPAEVEEVFLGGGALAAGVFLPLVGELGGGEGCGLRHCSSCWGIGQA